MENWGYRSREVRERISVVVAYDSDFDLVEELLADAASSTDRVLDDPAPAVRIVDFTSAGVQHELRFWIEDPEKGRANVKSIVYRKILDAFRLRRIEMPAPGLTLIEQRVPEEPPVD